LKLAAIDIGSNSIKFLVVDAAASDSFAVLAREKDVVRLGHNTLREGYLSESTIGRAAETIKRFRSIAETRGAERIFTTATASVREANNAAEFIDEIERLTGVRVEILSGVEEARLIGIAAAQGCGSDGASLVNIDIGGGSTEISLMRDGLPSALYSVKLGAVGLTERALSNDPPRQKELRALKEEIRAVLERPRRELSSQRWQHATGTSGTIISLGEALLLAGASDEELRKTEARPSGADIVLSRLSRFNERVSQLTLSQRRSVPGISTQRAEIIIAGGHILEGVMRALGINYLRTCDWALREGVIIDRLREIEAESRPPLPNLNDPRLRGVHALGRRFGYEETHSLHVARLAEQIFDAMAPGTDLNRHHRTLLSAAAILHDIGYHIAHDSHHKHSLYLIKHSELTGFSEAERDLIANIARYHRGAPPKERHPDFASLNAADRNAVLKLASILRIAESLDRSHDGRINEVRCRRNGQLTHFQLRCAEDCEKELWAAENRREMLEEAFNCRVSFAAKRTRAQNAA
jgi:exopolyphosphatase/guanosine-5'-triphosphate,3'-diphosphate pyrophosphatase